MQKSLVQAQSELSLARKFGVCCRRLFPAWQGSRDNSEGAGALHQTLLEKGHPSAGVDHMGLNSGSQSMLAFGGETNSCLMMSKHLGAAWGAPGKLAGVSSHLHSPVPDHIWLKRESSHG